MEERQEKPKPEEEEIKSNKMKRRNSHRAVRHRLELVPREQAPDQVEGVSLFGFFKESGNGKVVLGKEKESKKKSERESERGG